MFHAGILLGGGQSFKNSSALFIAQNFRFSSWGIQSWRAEAFDIHSVCLPLSFSFKNPLLLAIKGNRSYRSMMENTSREAAQMDRRC